MSTAVFRDASPEQSNFRHLVYDIGWFGLALATTTRFLSIYAIHVGANAAQISLLTALPALMLLITSLWGGWWRTRYPDTVKAVFWPSLGFRLMFLLPAFTPFLPATWQPYWLLLAVTLPAIPQGIGGVVFLVLMREAVPEHRYPLLQSQRFMVMNITIAVSALACGLWLESAPFPLNYQAMFLLAFVVTLVSLWHVMRVRPQYVAPVRRPQLFSRDLWRQPNLREMIFAIGVTHVSFFVIMPLVPLHLVDNLGATEGFIAAFGLAELLGGAGIAALAGRLVRRAGTRPLMGVAMLFTALSAVLIALAPALWLTLPAAFLLGASWTLVAINIIAYMNELSPDDYAGEYATVYTQAVGLSTFVGPVLGGMLAGANIHLVTLLLLGAGMRLVAGWLLLVPARPRAA